MKKRFKDRADAGRFLASRLEAHAGRKDTVVLGLPRGGVPVAYEVARALGAPLDVFVVRKLGVPGKEELALGAIASGGARFLNHEIVRRLEIAESTIEEITARETAELERREKLYRADREPVPVEGRIAILVDDGLATGASMRVAAAALNALEPARVVVAVPVAAYNTCDEMVRTGLEMICGRTPDPFVAVGAWYDDFRQTSDEEVCEILRRADLERESATGPSRGNRHPRESSPP